MTLRDMIDRVRGMMTKQEPDVDIDDNVTKDRYLRSLRREMRMHNEEEEKKFLLKRLADIKRQKLRENMFGIKQREKEKTILGNLPAMKQKVNILKQRRMI